jgi:hypothetical protein
MECPRLSRISGDKKKREGQRMYFPAPPKLLQAGYIQHMKVKLNLNFTFCTRLFPPTESKFFLYIFLFRSSRSNGLDLDIKLEIPYVLPSSLQILVSSSNSSLF